jgi:hypothetical protein
MAHRVQNNAKHTPTGPSWREKGRRSKHKHTANNHILEGKGEAEQAQTHCKLFSEKSSLGCS